MFVVFDKFRNSLFVAVANRTHIKVVALDPATGTQSLHRTIRSLSSNADGGKMVPELFIS